MNRLYYLDPIAEPNSSVTKMVEDSLFRAKQEEKHELIELVEYGNFGMIYAKVLIWRKNYEHKYERARADEYRVTPFSQ